MKLILVQLKSILFQLRLKDKHCGDEFVHEFEDGTKRMEQYIKVGKWWASVKWPGGQD